MGKAYESIWLIEEIKEKSAVAGDKNKKMSYADKTFNSLERGAKGLVSYASIKGTAEQIIQPEIARIELRTGASEYQQRVQSVYNIASSAANSLVSIGIGAATGNLPLVLIGVATKAVHSLITVAQRQLDLTLKEAKEDISINMASNRASTNGRRQ